VIEQAKGVLMAREGCSPDVAFDILRRASQRENRKVAVIAAEIVARVQRCR
jgi:AmiR/NasT family two-component response regulator